MPLPRRMRFLSLALPGAALLLAPVRPCAGALAAQEGDSAYVAAHYTKREVGIPMRDGVRLHTVVYVPRDAGPQRRYPVLLQRTPFSAGPYGPGAYPRRLAPSPFMLRDGYVFVTQDVRGRYLSEGTFENVRPLLSYSVHAHDVHATDEATDAYDTIEWLLRNLPEQNGRVGLLGVSYAGFYAAAAALAGHPAIRATSLQAPVTDVFFEDFHHNGALLLGHLLAYPIFGVPRPAPTAESWWLLDFLRVTARATDDDYGTLLGLGPLRNVTRDVYPSDVWWREMVAHPTYDAFWRARSIIPRLHRLPHPVLVVGGWFDAENLYGTLAAYRALSAPGSGPEPMLVMGPFGHRGWMDRDAGRTTHGDLYFGDSLAARYQRDVEAAFFRANLKGEPAAAPTGALVFDTGRKTWVRFPRWPAREAERRGFYFEADGSLGAAPRPGGRGFVEYTSDPRHPVRARCSGPTIEDGRLWSYMSDDQRCFTRRADVAVFQSGELREDVTFAGELAARLWVSTTGTDADFVVKLIDVYPATADAADPASAGRMAGYEQLVRGEIMRGRYRRSFRTPAPFRPNEVTEVSYRLPDVFHTFRKGHRIMVQVQSSWFPLFDRNPQRFVPSIFQAREDDFVTARQRIWVRPGAASRIEAPVLPEGAGIARWPSPSRLPVSASNGSGSGARRAARARRR
jgi:putative CocE/NonD family hydrolase